jgi:acetyltransferase-like isoleucine patch superfamily enzyme
MKIIKLWIGKLILKFLQYERMSRINNFISRGVLTVGEHTYGVKNIEIHEYKGSEAKVIIGKYCSIAPNVTIITGGIHPVDRVSTFPFRIKMNLKGKYQDGFPSTNGDVVIGNDVWIASNVIILSGISIGHGAVIAAGSVVIKNIPAYAIVGGNPAKVIRYRISSEKIKEIDELRWWDWDEIKIKNKVDYLNK